jgi:hypothetical protein
MYVEKKEGPMSLHTTTELIERLRELNKKFLAGTMMPQEREEAKDVTVVLEARGYTVQRGKRKGLRIHK